MDDGQVRSCNRSLFPQSGIRGQETEVSFSDANHWMELDQEYVADGMAGTADRIAICIFRLNVWVVAVYGWLEG